MQIKVNQYDVAEVGRYKGKFQIMVGKEKNGEFVPNFYVITKKDGSKANVPVTLTFDDDADAINFLNAAAKAVS